MDDVLKSNNVTPATLRSDFGSEYAGKEMKNSQKIIRLSMCKPAMKQKQRVIKILKLKLFRHMTYHRSIKMTPEEAQTVDPYVLWSIQYRDDKNFVNEKKTQFKYKVGDRVKVSYLKMKFSWEYSEKWTTEVFTVIERKLNQNIPMYKLKDYNNDVIGGHFYEPELQLSTYYPHDNPNDFIVQLPETFYLESGWHIALTE